MSTEYLFTRKHTLNISCKSKHFPRRYKRKREWVFFSEHSVYVWFWALQITAAVDNAKQNDTIRTLVYWGREGSETSVHELLEWSLVRHTVKNNSTTQLQNYFVVQTAILSGSLFQVTPVESDPSKAYVDSLS